MKVVGDVLARAGVTNEKLWCCVGVKDEKSGEYNNIFVNFSKEVSKGKPFEFLLKLVSDDKKSVWLRDIEGFLTSYNDTIQLKVTKLKKCELFDKGE